MENKENIANNLTVETGSNVASFEVSMKKIIAEQKKRRARFFYLLASFAFIVLLVTSALFFSSGKEATAGKMAYSVPDQDFLEEWPEQSAAIPAIKKTLTAVIAPQIQLSSKSLMDAIDPAKKKLNGSEVGYIRSELGNLYAVSFSKKTISADKTRTFGIASLQQRTEQIKSLPGRKNFSWYVGLGFNPQFANTHSGSQMADFYGANGKERAVTVYNLNPSVKVGFIYRRKWMVNVSAGYQSIKNPGKQFANAPMSPFMIPELPYSSNPVPAEFRGVNFSLEGARLVQFRNFGLKAGLRFSASHLRPADGSATAFDMFKHHQGTFHTKWMYSTGISVGVVKDISSHMQLQVAPNAFYRMNSLYNRNFAVHQKPYGLGLDLSLMIRLN